MEKLLELRDAKYKIASQYIKDYDEDTNKEIDDLDVSYDMAIKAVYQDPCGDAISRAELISRLQAWDHGANGVPNYAWKVIMDLPTVPPTQKVMTNIEFSEVVKTKEDLHELVQVQKMLKRAYDITDFDTALLVKNILNNIKSGYAFPYLGVIR